MADDGDLASRLRRLRDGRGWSAREMAERTGVPKRTLESYMLHENAALPGLEAIRKIAIGLDVSLDWLVFGSELASEDIGRVVRLCTYKTVLDAFTAVVRHHQEGKSISVTDTDFMGRTPDMWAAELSWLAGDIARNVVTLGVSRETIKTTQRVFDAKLAEELEREWELPKSSAIPE